MPVTAEDIAAYLDAHDDFDLELFVHRSLVGSGFHSELAGTCSDPASGRPQRFGVRARRFFPGARRQLLLAVECQSLPAECPLLVSRIPRSAPESYHEVVRSWQAREPGEDSVEVLRWERGLELYPENVQVGRRLARIAKDFGGESSQEQWSRAVMSAAELVKEANRACTERGTLDCYTLVLPVMVVSDGALWAMDYTESGQRARSALQVQETEIYLGREYELRTGYRYRISHLHLFTRGGFSRFLAKLAEPGSGLLEQMFQFTTLRDKPGTPDSTLARPRRRMRTGENNPRADLAPASPKIS